MAEFKQGRVYLVGAGLGGTEYLTLRAKDLLAKAEALVYDALVDDDLLQWIPADCELFYVGKRGGQPSTPQAEIDRLLVTLCQQGKQVIRLKSGDPFIFGRCASEIQALIAAHCNFEAVPGISSALAAPLLAGIPLTDPTLSRSFTVLTAHDLTVLDWTALAMQETLVMLMGGQNLAQIIHHLTQAGRSQQEPIAIIRWAGRPQQQVWTGTLATIVEQTTGLPLSPCIIVIGPVVTLRQQLTPPECPPRAVEYEQIVASLTAPPVSTVIDRPLLGKTILVTRSAGQSSQFTDLLTSQGAQVIDMPALEIGPPSNWDLLDGAIATLSQFDWLILTSTNGVEFFFQRLAAAGLDARALAGVKIAVVGEKTALSLTQQGLQADFIPPNFVADSLAAHLAAQETLQDKRLLFPRVESGGREVLITELTAQGAEVIEVPAYESRCPTQMTPAARTALENRKVHVVTFASSKTVKHFRQLLEQATSDWADWLEGVWIASIGPQTSASCQKLLGRVDIEAAEYTLEGLTQALIAATGSSSQ